MSSRRTPDWNDLQLLQAVLKAGSLTAAAAGLGVSQPTLSRRMRALEETFEVELFHRLGTGMEPTELAKRIGGLLSPMEGAVNRLRREIEDSRQEQKCLRLSTTSTISLLIAENISRLSPASGGTSLEVVATRQLTDFFLHEFDMAIRLRRQPVSGPVNTRKLGTLGFAVYAVRKVANSASTCLPCIGLADDRPPPQRQWFDGFARQKGGRIVARLGEVHLRLTAALDGVGAALLPCVLGDREAGLVGLTPPVPELAEEIFLLVHRDAALNSDLREISARLVRLFKEKAGNLSGG